MTPSEWWPRRHLMFALVLAALTHLVVVWAVPRVVMWRLAVNAPAELKQPGAVYLPPLTDHHQRRVVMPSPDLLYASCAFDVSTRPLRIRADPKTRSYWSIALYASQSDNFFVVNDVQAAGQPVDLVLVGPGAVASPALPAGARAVQAPTRRGLLLMRVLVSDPVRELAAAEAARRTLRCEPIDSEQGRAS